MSNQPQPIAAVVYAGFSYTIARGEKGFLIATPLPGQHRAAGKERHRRGAIDEYLADQREA